MVVGIMTTAVLTSCGDDDSVEKNKPEIYTLTYTITVNIPDPDGLLKDLHEYVSATLSKVATVSPLKGMTATVTFENWDKVEEGSKMLSDKREETHVVCGKYLIPNEGEELKGTVGYKLTNSAGECPSMFYLNFN